VRPRAITTTITDLSACHSGIGLKSICSVPQILSSFLHVFDGSIHSDTLMHWPLFQLARPVTAVS